MSENQSLATLMAAVLDDENGAIAPPIVQTSLFSFENYQAFEDRMAGRTLQPIYTRVQNPTVAAFEGFMAKAENGEEAVAFASGIAAITSSLMAFVKPGHSIACVEHVYPDTYKFMEQILRPFGVDVSYHSAQDFENNADLLDGVDLAYLESPSSIVFAPLNLPLVAKQAKAHGTLTLIDNSWASPVFQNPLDLGIDIVIHSASKYISGHSDTVAGVVVSNAENIGRIRDLTLPLFGAKLAPFEAFLLTRGLRTLNVRMMQHQSTANLFVDRFANVPQVRRVNSPGANSVPGLTGRSGLLSIEFDDSVDIPKFADMLQHFRLGVSWGGFESLILPARVGLAQAGEKNSMQKFGVSPNLVRLNLGLEDAEDLWADFEIALRKSAA
ncbi:MAG: PLP-dependent transferase [Marinosulfonomonas sp.]